MRIIFKSYAGIHPLPPNHTTNTYWWHGGCTLIDKIFCKLTDKSISSPAGIIHIKISGHFPYLLSLRLHTHSGDRSKLLKIGPNDKEAYEYKRKPIRRFQREMIPNHLKTLKNKNLQVRFVKFHEYQQKGNTWITAGVMRLTKYTEKSYKNYRTLIALPTCTARSSNNSTRITRSSKMWIEKQKSSITIPDLTKVNVMWRKLRLL